MKFITPEKQKEILNLKKETQIITLQTKINNKLKLGHNSIFLNKNEESLLFYIEEDLRNSGWEIKKDDWISNGKIIVNPNTVRYVITQTENK